MTSIFINPGTEPQRGATLDNAAQTIARFVGALGISEVAFARNQTNDSDGWFGFVLTSGDRKCEVDVPGINPHVVQEGRPWKSPRLYVDGNSWLWPYAINSAREALTGQAA
jgi:hypothetical protein